MTVLRDCPHFGPPNEDGYRSGHLDDCISGSDANCQSDEAKREAL